MNSIVRCLFLFSLPFVSAQALVLEQPAGEGEASSSTVYTEAESVDLPPASSSIEFEESPSITLVALEIRERSEFSFSKHIGRVGMGSGIYLGNGFVLTSAHVGCYPFQAKDGSVYLPDYQSWKVVNGENGSLTDLAIFRIETPDPNSSLGQLPVVPIADRPPSEDAPVILVGTGLRQKAEPATLRSGDKVLAVLGYHIDRKRSNLIGSNTVHRVLDTTIKSGNGQTHCFSTRFDRNSHNAQASDGDSGGASFVYNFDTRRWELAGCIIAVSQKDGFVPYGSRTFLADLSRYREQLPKINEAEGRAIVAVLVTNELERL